jgi:peptide/nickel transport system substrate-binding protein
MQKIKKISFILIVVLMLTIAMSACSAENAATTEEPVNNGATADTEEPEDTEEPVKTEEPVETEEPEVGFEEEPYGENLPTAPTIDTPLVVAIDDLSQKFSPFFAESGYDVEVEGMTQEILLTTDRVGGIVHNAIEGEVRTYNGVDYLYKGPANTSVVYDEATDTTKYTARLRVGMKFSDGEPVTADDLIFTYYTFLDPSYVGSTTLSSYPIIGLKEYQAQTSIEVIEKYTTFAQEIYAAGMDHEWSDSDAWTQELQDDFWARFQAEWEADLAANVEYVKANLLEGYAESVTGYTPEEITGNEGMEIMIGMVLWGFGDVDEDGSLITAVTGTTFDLVDNFPTLTDFFVETYEAYGGDPVAYADVESLKADLDITGPATREFVKYWGPLDEETGEGGVPNIAGIVKLDDYTVEITTAGYEAPAVYSIFQQEIAPLHYYGDVDKYDYENNMFGFDFGDLSKQESLTATPMGMGPYRFIQYDNKVVYFEANPYYFRGCPKVAELQYKETTSAEVPSALQTATADAGQLSYNATRYAEIQSYNSNGTMTGDVITSSLVDNLGYGYIGFNAATMNVAGEPGSVASKNLRKGFATVLAVYRDVVIDSYYGEAAAVINYPISNTSWAAPQPTDEGYQLAFSVDVNGDPIYTADMTPEEKEAAALAAALGFFEAAGFTVENGVLTTAPEGAKLSYEFIILGDGTGDHPSFGIVTAAKEALAEIGMELKINDPADDNVLWDALDAGTPEMWAAAWGTTIDPDMYQVYHSSNVVGRGGSDSNHYHIQSDLLDQLIIDARQSDDQAYRKAIYKQALDEVVDWAVELPTYQRKNVIIFSTPRVNIDSLTPDITTFWNWYFEIQVVEVQ